VTTHPKDNDDVIWIADLAVTSLLLFRDQRFRGYCILSFAARGATRLEDLSDLEYQAFCEDLRSSSRAIRAAMQPDLMNYELLGNSHPQLHWHIIPRYRSDLRWGRPIWEEWPRNEFKVNRVRLGHEKYQAIIQQIRKQLLAAP
jgi:diadenosine tetraphosphate (Ap4A) HIT family hydrolase